MPCFHGIDRGGHTDSNKPYPLVQKFLRLLWCIVALPAHLESHRPSQIPIKMAQLSGPDI